MILAYCLGDKGLRLTAAWAASIGLADVSNVALLKRLRNCGDWLAVLVGRALPETTPEAAHGRLIRIVDATTVPKAGADAATSNKLWRIHGAFDLPSERFGFFELTDERGGETLDRVPVVKGEIRIADRAYLQPVRLAKYRCGRRRYHRAGWLAERTLARSRWQAGRSARGAPQGAGDGHLDRPIWIGRSPVQPLPMRLVAVRKPPQAAEAARRKARREARRGGHQLSKGTLAAADWVILITSLGARSLQPPTSSLSIAHAGGSSWHSNGSKASSA